MDETFRALMTELGNAIGASELEIEDNSTGIAFGDIDVLFTLNTDSRTLFIYAALGELPENNREALCLKLLDANVFFKDTQGFTLAAHQKEGISLNAAVRAETLRTGDIVTLTENFVSTAERWKEIVLNAGSGQTENGNDSQPGSAVPDNAIRC